ncbi:hypothetical protein EV421DRAFT_1906177 [Armillaria borealis]|uniref:Uncharacterized protein n=1 Tax=Armillaria borealis TaxID=47425 RepID=A0AA39JBX9_9AGAR|nr:hypothetical protein EV421DRAFT_1906177 [Armillaria borealis]
MSHAYPHLFEGHISFPFITLDILSVDSTAPRRRSASLYRRTEGIPVISRPNSSHAPTSAGNELRSQVDTMRTAFPLSWNIAGRLLDVPLALQKHITVSKTIDVYEFMKRLGSEAELPEPCIGHTAELHRREQIVTAICHTLLSFMGFNLASHHKTSTNKLELSQDATKRSRYLSYSIEPLEFDFALEVLDPGPDHLHPSVMASIGWKRGSVDVETAAKQYVTSTLSLGNYVDESTTFPAQIDRLVDTGFKSMAVFVKFVQLMQEHLLEPLWKNIRIWALPILFQKALEEAEANLRKAELERTEPGTSFVEETNADWWLEEHNGHSLFPADYVEKMAPAPASRILPPPHVPPTRGRSVPPAPSEKKEYKPFMAATQTPTPLRLPERVPTPSGFSRTWARLGRRASLESTMAHSAASGVGFGAGAAIGGVLVRAIF